MLSNEKVRLPYKKIIYYFSHLLNQISQNNGKQNESFSPFVTHISEHFQSHSLKHILSFIYCWKEVLSILKTSQYCLCTPNIKQDTSY